MIIINTLILLLTFYLSIIISRFFKVSELKITILFIFRTIICLIYNPIAISSNLDSYGYFNFAFSSELEKFYGTDLIFSLSRFLQSFLNIDFYSMTFIFSFIGIIGSIAFISNIKNLTKNVDRRMKILVELIIFFPTLNIWTSAIGKDAITFTCLNLIIFSLLNIKNRILTLLLSSIICSLIRPFAGIILFFCLLIVFTSKINIPLIYKLLIRVSLISGMIFINSINFAFLRFGNLQEYDFLEITKFYSEQTAAGNTAVNAESLNLGMKIFTFMFRPLFIDADSLYTFLMSFENIILLVITLYPFIKLLKKFKFKKLTINPITIFSSLYIAITWLGYSLTIFNLGTANRYKLMILPILIPLILTLSKDSKYLQLQMISK